MFGVHSPPMWFTQLLYSAIKSAAKAAFINQCGASEGRPSVERNSPAENDWIY